MPKGKAQYTREIAVPMTVEMFDIIDLLAKRGRGSRAGIVRDAIRAHLDAQDDLIGSRSRYANRVARQLEIERSRLDRWAILILAALLFEYQQRQPGHGLDFLHKLQGMAADTETAIRAVADKTPIPPRR